MQCGQLLMKTPAAGAYIGSETWMGIEPQPAKALYGDASGVTFNPVESWESKSSSAEEEVVEEGEEVASVARAPGPETRTRELTKLPSLCLLQASQLPLSSLTTFASSCPPLTAPARSLGKQYLRATEKLALHINYISGFLPRALQLSSHIQNKTKQNKVLCRNQGSP